MISTKHQCIFVHIPKCGGTSIEDAIWAESDKTPENLFMGFIDKYYNAYQTGGLQHLKGLQIRHHVGRATYNDCFKFSIVRNPFDKAVSQFKYVQKRRDLRKFIGLGKKDDFLTYLKKTRAKTHVQWDTQVSFVYDYSGKQIVDYVGRFEELQSAFEHIAGKLNLQVPLPHKKRSTDKAPYQSFYNDESIALIREIYEEDLDVFGYDFDS